MDIYVQKKLKRWNFTRYVGIFRENGVSKNNFHLLTEDAIAGLIPNMASRKSFLKKFKHFKMIRRIENTEVPSTSCSPELQEESSSSSSHSLQNNSSSLHKTDLKALLMKNRAGQQILNALQSGKAPTNFLRRRLVVFLFDNLLQSCDNDPSSEQKVELAKKIVEEFPHIYIWKKDAISESGQLEFQSDENINIENQMEIEIEAPSLPDSKQIQEGTDPCDFCSKETSLYVVCNGMCKLKFCNDCCGIADLKRLSKATKIGWICKSCKKRRTSSIHSEQKDGLSHNENSEVDVNFSESSNIALNVMDPLQALEFYNSESTNEASEYTRCQNAGGNYSEVNNEASLEISVSSYQDVNSDTTHSGTLALICSEEPIIKKEPDVSYDNMAITELPTPTKVTSADYSKAATSSRGIIGNKGNSAVTNQKKLKKTNVKTILKKTVQGKQLLKSVESGDITTKTRSRLARILVQHLVDRHGLYFPMSMLKSVALAIIKQLPLLSEAFGDHEVWYSEEQVEEGIGAIPNSPPRGFLFHRLMVLRRKAAAKKKKKDAKKQLKDHKTKEESQKIKYTVSEMQRAQEEVLNALNEVWKNMSSFYGHEDADLQKTGTTDGQETSLRRPGTTVSESDVGNADSIASYDDCVVSKDEEVGDIDEEDGLTVVAYEDYCSLKNQNDTLRGQIKREKELRQIAEKKLAEVQAEKLALEKEIADFKARRTLLTRWKHSTVEYCRRSFER